MEFFVVCHQTVKSCDHKHCDSGHILLLICHETSPEHMFSSFMTETLSLGNQSIDFLCESMDWFLYDRRVIWVYWWKTLLISHHVGMYGGHWSIACGDIKYLVCRLTSQNHMIEGHVTSWVRTPHGMSHLAKFGCYMYRISRDIMFSVCHVIKLDYFSKGSVDYNNRRPSK